MRESGVVGAPNSGHALRHRRLHAPQPAPRPRGHRLRRLPSRRRSTTTRCGASSTCTTSNSTRRATSANLLVTSAHADPEITSFLSCWVVRGAVARRGARCRCSPPTAARRAPSGCGRSGVASASATSSARSSAPSARRSSGANFIALHTTWGAINEWTTQAGYVRLAARSGHPVLGELVRRIAKQEGRHIDFYAVPGRQPPRRPAPCRRPACAGRSASCGDRSAPGVMPADETRFLVNHLFSGDEGLEMGRRLDRRIDRPTRPRRPPSHRAHDRRRSPSRRRATSSALHPSAGCTPVGAPGTPGRRF